MCTALFSWRDDPEYRLVLALNRDEFYARPTAAAHFWTERPDLLAGRDLREGGTWMGVTKGGRIAFLTSFREGRREELPSRGFLVRDFLTGSGIPQEYLAEIASLRCNGYNLVVGDLSGEGSLFHYSNREGRIREIEPGVHGLSNHLLDTPWPKVARGRDSLRRILRERHPLPDLEAGLMGVLSDESRSPDDSLPDTGVGILQERFLSALFLSSPVYGTCSSSVLTVSFRTCRLLERRYAPCGKIEGTAAHAFPGFA